MLERCSPRYAPGVGCTRKDITRERKGTQTQLDLQWEYPSDGSQVIGENLLIGQLVPRVTPVVSPQRERKHKGLPVTYSIRLL